MNYTALIINDEALERDAIALLISHSGRPDCDGEGIRLHDDQPADPRDDHQRTDILDGQQGHLALGHQPVHRTVHTSGRHCALRRLRRREDRTRTYEQEDARIVLDNGLRPDGRYFLATAFHLAPVHHQSITNSSETKKDLLGIEGRSFLHQYETD
jgi:hypothetical protein